jgi:hypothetical protein
MQYTYLLNDKVRLSGLLVNLLVHAVRWPAAALDACAAAGDQELVRAYMYCHLDKGTCAMCLPYIFVNHMANMYPVCSFLPLSAQLQMLLQR